MGTVPNGGYQTILIEENGVGGFGADFAQAGLGGVVRVVTTNNKNKQNIYQRFIKDLEGGELALPNHTKLVNQTTALEKTFTPTNKAKYSHPPGGHDDWPDACAFANWARHGGGQQMDVGQSNDVPLAW
jgi:phage FluMu gp28-like protein